jgi:hypothetical protein
MVPGETPGSDWRYVMTGSWDFNQNLSDSHRVEWPRGPLKLARGEEPRWVEAWVVQSSTGASQRTAQYSGWAAGHWTADGIPPGWINGSFQAGPALGIALLASHNTITNTDEYFWWVEEVVLN